MVVVLIPFENEADARAFMEDLADQDVQSVGIDFKDMGEMAPVLN